MLRIQWNTLKVGDAIYVHGDAGALVAGVVAMVSQADVDGGSNEVGVRFDAGDECAYVWPSHTDVHTDPVEVTDSCAHCRLLRL